MQFVTKSTSAAFFVHRMKGKMIFLDLRLGLISFTVRFKRPKAGPVWILQDLLPRVPGNKNFEDEYHTVKVSVDEFLDAVTTKMEWQPSD